MIRGESNYYKIVNSLGELKICSIQKEDVTNAGFGMKITKIDENNNYGTHKFFQIELFENGLYKDIRINDYTFSYLVKSNTHYYSSYQTFENDIFIEFKDKYGTKFQIRANCCDLDNERTEGLALMYIIYIMLYTEETKSAEDTNRFCTTFFSQRYTCGLENSIKTIKQYHSIKPKLREKYPLIVDYMEQYLELNVKREIENIKNQLYEVIMLENK